MTRFATSDLLWRRFWRSSVGLHRGHVLEDTRAMYICTGGNSSGLSRMSRFVPYYRRMLRGSDLEQLCLRDLAKDLVADVRVTGRILRDSAER